MFPLLGDGHAHMCIQEAIGTHVIPDLGSVIVDYLTFSGQVEVTFDVGVTVTSMTRISPTELAIGTYGQGVKILDCTTMQITHEINCFSAYNVSSIPGYVAYTVGHDAVYICNLDSRAVTEHTFDMIRSLTVSEDSFILTTEDELVQWKASTQVFTPVPRNESMIDTDVIQATILPDGRNIFITSHTLVINDVIFLSIPTYNELTDLVVISNVYVGVANHTTVFVVNLITRNIDLLKQPASPVFTLAGVNNLVPDSFIIAVGLPDIVCLWELGGKTPTLLEQSNDVRAIVQLDNRLVSAMANGILTFWR